jgi:uncharacterized damage-inducible protein DinB
MPPGAKGYSPESISAYDDVDSIFCNLKPLFPSKDADTGAARRIRGVSQVMPTLLTGQTLFTSGDGPADRQVPAAILPIVAVLRQLVDVILAMTDEQYRRKPVGVVSSNVGSHVRHSLDHVEALLAGVEEGKVNYDRRQRGTDVETSRQAALDVIRRQERQLLAFPYSESRPLRLSVMVSSCLPSTEVQTTVGRELAFLLSHTVHHNALIAVMALTLGVSVPDRFGYAPSTIAHLEKVACAQ